MTSSTKKPEPLTGSDSKKTGSQLGSGSFTCANLPANDLTLFRPWLDKWKLVPQGKPWKTHSSQLLTVRMDGAAAVLKIASDAHEVRGGKLLAWWEGDGAAKVYASSANAFVIERAEGTRSLMTMALQGFDDMASTIACSTVSRLHAHKSPSGETPELVSLQSWFTELTAVSHDSRILQICANQAIKLLSAQQDMTVLHGDIHHDNILDFAERGWLAIDPKGLYGERGYDYANLIVNPDLHTVANPARFDRQVRVVSEQAGLNSQRLLAWVLAVSGLSALWFMQDGDIQHASQDLAVARMAAQSLSINPD